MNSERGKADILFKACHLIQFYTVLIRTATLTISKVIDAKSQIVIFLGQSVQPEMLTLQWALS